MLTQFRWIEKINSNNYRCSYKISHEYLVKFYFTENYKHFLYVFFVRIDFEFIGQNKNSGQNIFKKLFLTLYPNWFSFFNFTISNIVLSNNPLFSVNSIILAFIVFVSLVSNFWNFVWTFYSKFLFVVPKCKEQIIIIVCTQAKQFEFLDGKFESIQFEVFLSECSYDLNLNSAWFIL